MRLVAIPAPAILCLLLGAPTREGLGKTSLEKLVTLAGEQEWLEMFGDEIVELST
jgi:hypothetical protein